MALDKITTDIIADDAVTAAKIVAGAVVADIANDSIDSQHYVAASIDNEHLADDAVGAAELASNAVTTAKISDGNITIPKLKEENITQSAIKRSVHKAWVMGA